MSKFVTGIMSKVDDLWYAIYGNETKPNPLFMEGIHQILDDVYDAGLNRFLEAMRKGKIDG